MIYGNQREMQKAMRTHLRSGVTPGLFAMDALRVDELRYRVPKASVADQKGSLVTNRAYAWVKAAWSFLGRIFARNRIADVC